MNIFDARPQTEIMREALRPRGSANVSVLDMGNRFVNYDFVLKCIDELERMPVKFQLSGQASNLEKLAYMLLCDSAGINTN